jgi:hypothetical protein
MQVHDLARELPVKRLDLGFRFEVEQTEIEHLLGLFLDLFTSMMSRKGFGSDSVASILASGTSFSIAPKASTTRTEWWATIARPPSLTIAG